MFCRPPAAWKRALDRLANRIRHADYGASGFFDAVKIGQDELEAIYAFDLALSENVEYLAVQVEQLPETADEDMVTRLVSTPYNRRTVGLTSERQSSKT